MVVQMHNKKNDGNINVLANDLIKLSHKSLPLQCNPPQ